jgi:hypothetical protein
MTNEAILRQEYSLPVNFTCADDAGIEQGAILKLADPMTASLADGDEDYVAGICATEKIINDGTTSVSVYIDGVFDIMCSGAVTAGQAVATAASTEGSNYVTAATATAVGTKTLGIALEDCGASDERILVRLQPGCNNTAY